MPKHRPYKIFCLCNNDWPTLPYRVQANCNDADEISVGPRCQRCGYLTWYFTRQGAHAKFQRAINLMYKAEIYYAEEAKALRKKNNGPLDPILREGVDLAKIGK